MRRALFLILLFLPFSVEAHREASACKAVFEQSNPHTPPVIEEMNSEPVLMTWQGQEVQLEWLEAATLQVLISAPLVTYSELTRRVWGRESVPISTIRSVIKGLREKLRQVDPGFRAILNVHKVGFKWNFGEKSLPISSGNPHEPPAIDSIGDVFIARWLERSVELTAMEAKLLKVLTEHFHCTYEELGRLVWNNPDIPRGSIVSLMRNLRYKLKKISPDFAAILNYQKSGYQWNWGGGPFAAPKFLEVTPEGFRVRWFGNFFTLSGTEVLVWQALLRHFPATFQDIARAVANDARLPIPHVIKLVKDLMRKLHAVAPDHEAIQSVPQVGYQWNWGVNPKLELTFDLKPEFSSALELDSQTNFVKWKDNVFPLFPAEFLALKALVWPIASPLLGKQDLIDQIYGDGKPMKGDVFDLLKSVIDKIVAVDPEFNAIQRIFANKEWNYFWAERPIPYVEALGGRLRIGESVPLVWLDGNLVNTEDGEYHLLRKLQKFGFVDLSADRQYEDAVASVNMKLGDDLGGKMALVRQKRVVRFCNTK